MIYLEILGRPLLWRVLGGRLRSLFLFFFSAHFLLHGFHDFYVLA